MMVDTVVGAVRVVLPSYVGMTLVTNLDGFVVVESSIGRSCVVNTSNGHGSASRACWGIPLSLARASIQSWGPM
jgi:hypothetical protein